MKLIDPSTIYEENYYAKRREDPWRSDAHSVSRALREYFEPNSVIDFGCAIGAHLELFYEENIEIKGVEGNSDAFKYAVVPVEHLVEHDLREPYDPERSYDIAFCFEVAEHLPEEYADVLVDTLTKSSDTIVMTAAPPGQGGTHHVNEQPPEYWCDKFESRGFEYDSQDVETLVNRIEVEESIWIQENLMVFRSGTDL
jgi:SAM-dependent methyltransferase